MHHTGLRVLAHCHKNKEAGNTQMLVNERLIPVRQHWRPGISQANESHKTALYTNLDIDKWIRYNK